MSSRTRVTLSIAGISTTLAIIATMVTSASAGSYGPYCSFYAAPVTFQFTTGNPADGVDVTAHATAHCAVTTGLKVTVCVQDGQAVTDHNLACTVVVKTFGANACYPPIDVTYHIKWNERCYYTYRTYVNVFGYWDKSSSSSICGDSSVGY